MDVYYINLDYRTDRRQEFLAECKRIGIPTYAIYRFPAIKDAVTPYLGCTKSHLEVLRTAKRLHLPMVMICEDDLSFKQGAIAWPDIVKLVEVELENKFDVLMLASNTLRKLPCSEGKKWAQVVSAQTASGYIVHSRFYDRLIAVLEEAVQQIILHKANPRCADRWTVDQAWKVLQPVSDWYVCEPTLAYQRPSYSDLGGTYVNYGV